MNEEQREDNGNICMSAGVKVVVLGCLLKHVSVVYGFVHMQVLARPTYGKVVACLQGKGR